MYQTTLVLVCDGCLRSERMDHQSYMEGAVPEGWEKVPLEGWVGVFHVCSESCVQLLRDRVETPDHG